MKSVAQALEILSHEDFTACVDQCVSELLAQPNSGLQQRARCQTQLRHWLGPGASALEDGTPVDFALFDSTILSVEERLPVSSSAGHTQLLRAARELAETVYAVPSRIAART